MVFGSAVGPVLYAFIEKYTGKFESAFLFGAIAPMIVCLFSLFVL